MDKVTVASKLQPRTGTYRRMSAAASAPVVGLCPIEQA